MRSIKNFFEKLLGTKRYIALRERWFLFRGAFALCPKLINWWVYLLDICFLLPKGLHVLKYKNGMNIFFRAHTFDSLIHLEVFGRGEYAVPFAHGNTPIRIIDLGAQTGVFALYALSRVPEAHITCVEAVSENLTLLEKNIQANNANAHIKTIHAAVWSTTGKTLTMQIHAGNSGGHSAVHTGSEFSTGEQIHTLSLADIVRHEKCDLLKIDIEGAEYEVLFNADRETLECIHTIIGEVDGSDEENDRLVQYLSKVGFKTSINKRILYAIRV